MYINANSFTNPNIFPTSLDIAPNGTVLNMNGAVTTLDYTMYAGPYFLGDLTLQISTSTRLTSANYITLTIPGPASVLTLSEMLTGSGTFELSNHDVNYQVNTAINNYLTLTPSILGIPVSIVYNGNDKTGTWSVTITGNAPDTLPSTGITTTTFLPSGEVSISVQCNAVDEIGNVYFWGDINGIYDVERIYWYYVGIEVATISGNIVPMMLLDGTTSPAQYLRVDHMPYQWVYLALQQITLNPQPTLYDSLFPTVPFNPLIREQKVAAQKYSYVFRQYLYSI